MAYITCEAITTGCRENWFALIVDLLSSGPSMLVKYVRTSSDTNQSLSRMQSVLNLCDRRL